jgi:hypothetical protein
MPVESELDTCAPESFTSKAAGLRKPVARHHHWALVASIVALLLSMASLGISGASYRSANHITDVASHGLTEQAQNAFLESEIRLDRNLANFEQPPGNAVPIRLLFSLTLRNAGNTPATRIHLKWIESLIGTSNIPIRPSDEHNLPAYDLDKHQEENLPLVIEMTSEEFRRFVHHGTSRLEITGEVNYKDISNRDRTLNWTASLNGDSILKVE